MTGIPLCNGRSNYNCKSCNETIPKGDSHLNLGGSYRGGNLGRVCKKCIVYTAEKIKMEEIE